MFLAAVLRFRQRLNFYLFSTLILSGQAWLWVRVDGLLVSSVLVVLLVVVVVVSVGLLVVVVAVHGFGAGVRALLYGGCRGY